MLLHLLAEAVNTVADHPQYAAMCDDSPIERQLGYRIGPFRFRCSITEARRDFPEIEAKRDELKAMVARVRKPLLPYPACQREREIIVRHALLSAATHVSNIEMRRETAKWITFLGRMRAAPNGSLIHGGTGGIVEPDDYGFYL